MYYILDNEKIVLCDKEKEHLENTLIFTPQYQNTEILETSKNIIEFEGEFYFEDDKEYLAKIERAEKARINEISLTRADVFEALILSRGLTKVNLRTFIEEDSSLTPIEKTLYLNRFDDALEFYRKHPAIDFIAQKLEITSEDMDKFFVTKDYSYLKEKTSTTNNTQM